MASPDAEHVIEETLKAIAEDDLACLLGDALREAWTGQRFDEDALRTRFATLAEAEATT